MNDETPSTDVLVPPADTTDVQPVVVTLGDLAKVSSATPIAQLLKRQPVPFDKRPPKTPAGLPQGCSWLPHDTGKLGRAAARRRAQAERLAAKRAAKAIER